jgi:cell division protein FtsB
MSQVAQRARSRGSLRAAILAALVTAILIAAAPLLKTYLSERSKISNLSHQAQVLEEQNRRLQNRIDRLHDKTYLEQLARECLGMVRPGEVAFVVVQKGQRTPKPPAC